HGEQEPAADDEHRQHERGRGGPDPPRPTIGDRPRRRRTWRASANDRLRGRRLLPAHCGTASVQIVPLLTASSIQGMTSSSISSRVVLASKPSIFLAFSVSGTRRWTSYSNGSSWTS